MRRKEAIVVDEAIHRHHWLIDRHQHGICSCGAEKDFPLPGLSWITRSDEMAAKVKQGNAARHAGTLEGK